MSVARKLLKAIGASAALFGGTAATTAAASEEGERDAPTAAVHGFGPERLLGEPGALAGLADDPAAFLRARGLDPAAYQLSRGADAITRFAAEWGAPASIEESAAGWDDPSAQVAVYGPPPGPAMTPTPQPTATPPPAGSHGKNGRMRRRHTAAPTPMPSPTASPPAPVYGPPPGAPNAK